jgi:hypothetical protein
MPVGWKWELSHGIIEKDSGSMKSITAWHEHGLTGHIALNFVLGTSYTYQHNNAHETELFFNAQKYVKILK